jgi:hypothetical protein
MQMVKKISHSYLHVGTALSPHADAARPYLLSLSLSLSLSISLRLSLAGPRGRSSQRPAWSTKLTWPSTTSRRDGSPSSARWPFLHHHGERHVRSSSSTKVAICFFTAGVSSHLRQAGPSHLLHHLLGCRPLGHLHRRHHHVQVSSPCSSVALSLSHHSSPSSSTARGAACHGTLTAACSSSSRRTSRSGWLCQSTRRLWSQARQRWCSAAARSTRWSRR